MFNNLLESRPVKQKALGGSILSAVIHVALIVGAVAATAKAKEAVEELKKEDIAPLVVEKKEEPPPPEESKAPPPPDQPNTPPPPKGFQTLTAPKDIPTVIPEIDLTARVTNELDFTGEGVRGGVASGVVGGTGKVETDQPYYMFEVEKMAQAAPGNPRPNYPSILRTTKTTGTVLVSFVVDTTGKADMSTFKVVESSHSLFSAEVQKILPRYKFIPAEVGNRKVPVYVQLPFEFTLDGGGQF